MDGTRDELVIAQPDEIAGLNALSDLAASRRAAVSLYQLVPSPSLATMLDAVDHILLRRYRRQIEMGRGREAAALLSLAGAGHILRAMEHRSPLQESA